MATGPPIPLDPSLDPLLRIYTTALFHSENFPSEHETLAGCWFNVGPVSQTVDQHSTNIDWANVSCLLGWHLLSLKHLTT